MSRQCGQFVGRATGGGTLVSLRFSSGAYEFRACERIGFQIPNSRFEKPKPLIYQA